MRQQRLESQDPTRISSSALCRGRACFAQPRSRGAGVPLEPRAAGAPSGTRRRECRAHRGRGELLEMAPPQLSPQRGDSFWLGKRLSEADHVPQRFLAEPAPVAPLQLSPHRGDNPAAVLGATLIEDLAMNTISDLPVQRCQRGIRSGRYLLARRLDHRTEITNQRRHNQPAGNSPRRGEHFRGSLAHARSTAGLLAGSRHGNGWATQIASRIGPHAHGERVQASALAHVPPRWPSRHRLARAPSHVRESPRDAWSAAQGSPGAARPCGHPHDHAVLAPIAERSARRGRVARLRHVEHRAWATVGQRPLGHHPSGEHQTLKSVAAAGSEPAAGTAVTA